MKRGAGFNDSRGSNQRRNGMEQRLYIERLLYHDAIRPAFHRPSPPQCTAVCRANHDGNCRSCRVRAQGVQDIPPCIMMLHPEINNDKFRLLAPDQIVRAHSRLPRDSCIPFRRKQILQEGNNRCVIIHNGNSWSHDFHRIRPFVYRMITGRNSGTRVLIVPCVSHTTN